MTSAVSYTTFNFENSGIPELIKFATDIQQGRIIDVNYDERSSTPFNFTLDYLLEMYDRELNYSPMEPGILSTIQEFVQQFIIWLGENIDAILASKIPSESLLGMTKIVISLITVFNQDTQNADVILLLSRALRYITRHYKRDIFVNGVIIDVLKNHYKNPEIFFELVCCMHNINYSATDVNRIYDEYVEFLIKGLHFYQDNLDLQKEILSVCRIIILKVDDLVSSERTQWPNNKKKADIYYTFLHSGFFDLAFERINMYCEINNDIVVSYLLVIYELVSSSEKIQCQYAAQNDYFQMMKKLIDTYHSSSTVDSHIRQLSLDIISSLAFDDINYTKYCEAFSNDYFVDIVQKHEGDLGVQIYVARIFTYLSSRQSQLLYTRSSWYCEHH